MTSENWFSPGTDVHVRIWLGDAVFDYAATSVAALNLIQDSSRKHWCAVGLISDAIEECRLLPRLPCERLFNGP